jgi:hypothetical protein
MSEAFHLSYGLAWIVHREKEHNVFRPGLGVLAQSGADVVIAARQSPEDSAAMLIRG